MTNCGTVGEFAVPFFQSRTSSELKGCTSNLKYRLEGILYFWFGFPKGKTLFVTPL